LKILHLLKKEPSESIKEIIDVQSREYDVKVVRLSEVVDYKELVGDIFDFDQVICW
jgi:hypothetical protein